MTAALKLAHKGAILVAAVSISSIIFATVLVCHVQGWERKTQQVTRITSLIGRANELASSFYDAAVALSGYADTKSSMSSDMYMQTSKRIPDQMREVAQLAQDKDQQILAKLQSQQTLGLKQLDDYKTELDGESAQDAKLQRAVLWSQARQIADGIHDSVLVLVASESKWLESQNTIDARTESMMVGTLLACVSVSAIINAALTAYFVSSVSRRTKAVTENLERLATGRPLSTLRGGSDEFAELEQAVAKLAGSNLEISQDAAAEREKVEHSQRALNAMIARDLHQPLSSLQSLLRLLSDHYYGTLSAAGAEKLKSSSDDLARLIKTVNDISTIDRLESSLEPPNRQEIAVQELLARACDSLKSRTEDAGTPINCESTSAFAFVDAQQIERVLSSMLANAIKFSHRGEPVRVNVNDENGWVEIRISDTGSGVPLELLDCLFDRYKPYKDADRRVRNGSGLGLPLCKAIIEAHGGDLGVVSEPGKGSMFWFRIQSAKQSAAGTTSGA